MIDVTQTSLKVLYESALNIILIYTVGIFFIAFLTSATILSFILIPFKRYLTQKIKLKHRQAILGLLGFFGIICWIAIPLFLMPYLFPFPSYGEVDVSYISTSECGSKTLSF